jgi:hypothetical protein
VDKVAIVNTVFSAVTAIVAIGCLTGLLNTWLSRRGASRQVSNELLSRLDNIAERIAQLDGSIETMAVEVERISEAQRFTARILAERSPAAQLPEPTRSAGHSTPH